MIGIPPIKDRALPATLNFIQNSYAHAGVDPKAHPLGPAPTDSVELNPANVVQS